MAELLIDRRFKTIADGVKGGTSAVYKARDLQTGRIVALKVLTLDQPDDIVRFGREAALLATVHHPNVVDYVAHGKADGMYYLAQEWIEGANLARHMRSHGLTAREAIEIVAAVASALEAIHALDVIHRDIKPPNVIVPDELAKTKLVDFGIARLASSAGVLTRAGTAVGTPSYMAPEQARAVTEIGPAADVWALGCVLYESLTGRQAFRGRTPEAIRAKVLLAQLPSVAAGCPEAPPEIATLLFEMLHKDARMRPPSADVASRLRALPMIPDGPRRKMSTSTTETSERTGVLPFKPKLGAYVMVSLPEDVGPEANTRVAEIAKQHHLDVLMLDERSTLLTATEGGKEGALAAAQAAIQLRGAISDSAVSVFGQSSEDNFEESIDRGAAMLERAAITAAFAVPSSSPEVIVDDVIAKLVDADLDVVQTPEGAQVKARG